MTAYGTPGMAEAARALGAFAVIDKPFDMGDLAPLAEQASGYRCAQPSIGGPIQPIRRMR
jgi:DNA-binding NtrC family response regulator